MSCSISAEEAVMHSRIRISAIIAGVALLGVTSTVYAQWSIGAPGKREAPAGMNRYAWIVLANPNPGMEVEFNDWYQNTHMATWCSCRASPARSDSAWWRNSIRGRPGKATGTGS